MNDINYKLEEGQMKTRLYANGDDSVKFPSTRFKQIKIFSECQICGQTLYEHNGICHWCEKNIA